MQDVQGLQAGPPPGSRALGVQRTDLPRQTPTLSGAAGQGKPPGVRGPRSLPVTKLSAELGEPQPGAGRGGGGSHGALPQSGRASTTLPEDGTTGTGNAPQSLAPRKPASKHPHSLEATDPPRAGSLFLLQLEKIGQCHLPGGGGGRVLVLGPVHNHHTQHPWWPGTPGSSALLTRTLPSSPPRPRPHGPCPLPAEGTPNPQRQSAQHPGPTTLALPQPCAHRAQRPIAPPEVKL